MTKIYYQQTDAIRTVPTLVWDSMKHYCKRCSPIFILLFASCATSTETRNALFHDAAHKPLSGAKVELLGEPPKFFPFGIAEGVLYTCTITDDYGFCTLLYPTKRNWILRVSRNHHRFSLERVTEKGPYMKIEVRQNLTQ